MLLAVGAISGLALLMFVHLLPIQLMREHVYYSMDMIEKEFDNEVLIDGYRSTLTGNFTDCLMLEYTVYSSEEHSLLEQVLHMYRSESCPSRTDSGEEWWPGQSLKDYVTGVPQPREVSYSRYWHGYLILLKPLLLLTSFNTIRLLQSAVQMVLTGCVVTMLCRKGAYPLVKAYLISLPFLFFVSTYASLSLSICFYIMSIAILIQLKTEDFLAGHGWYGWFFMVVGMVTVYFDLLTYPLVTLVYPLGIYLYFHGETPGKDIHSMVRNSIEWGIGYTGMWAAKWILADCLTGSSSIQDAIRTIFVRIGSAEGYSRIGGFFTVLGKNMQPFLNWCYFLIGAAFVVVFLITAARNNFENIAQNLSHAAAFFFLALYPIAWLFLMQNHSEQHWQYTCRILGASVFAAISGCWMLLEHDSPKNT